MQNNMDSCRFGALHSAPLAEITTPAFRRLLRSFSLDVIIYSEMISARAMLGGGMHNDSLTGIHDFDDPFVWQLLGNEPESMARAALKLGELDRLRLQRKPGAGPRGVDINMGCSAPEIRSSGLGSALLKDVPLALEIVRECRRVCAGTLSVKMRGGFERVDASFVKDFIEKLAAEGVDYVTLHGRGAKDAFRRSADWGLCADIARTSPIPLVGNGDIGDYRRALKCLALVPAIMIGRAMVAQPWIFAQIACARGGGGDFTIPLRQCALDLISYTREYLPENLHRSRLHRFFAFYCRSLTFGHALFTKVRALSDAGSIEQELLAYFERNQGEIERVVQVEAQS